MTRNQGTTIMRDRRPERRYEIRVRGRLGPMLREAFPTLSAQPLDGDTLLSGSLPDQGSLFGLLCEIDSLGLELLEVRACGCAIGLPLAEAGNARGERVVRVD
jgi:hypothetical protein